MSFWEKIINFFKEILSAKPSPPLKQAEDLPWMKIAKSQLGVSEVPGNQKNPIIEDYHRAASFGGDEDDSWCSSFACYCMEKAGFKSTKNPWARSWLGWGQHLEKPEYGCVVVFWREKPSSWKGHVAFYQGEDKESVFVLGGNHDNAVKVKAYPKSQILGYRWPKNYPLTKS